MKLKLTNNEILEILNLVRYELLMRDCNFVNTDRDLNATGLCALIIQAFLLNHPEYHSVPNARIIIREFTKESCNKIATIREDILYWWSVNTFYCGHFSDPPRMGKYDVESRLKVINHFIELYSNKIDHNCIF